MRGKNRWSISGLIETALLFVLMRSAKLWGQLLVNLIVLGNLAQRAHILQPIKSELREVLSSAKDESSLN